MPVYNLRVDNGALTRVAALLPIVQASYALYLAANPHVIPRIVDTSFVYEGAVGVGLNIWRQPSLWANYPLGQGPDVPTVATFTPHAGLLPSTIAVTVSDYDNARAEAIVLALGGLFGGGPALVNVIGCACCTGLARMLGFYPIQGPFS